MTFFWGSEMSKSDKIFVEGSSVNFSHERHIEVSNYFPTLKGDWCDMKLDACLMNNRILFFHIQKNT